MTALDTLPLENFLRETIGLASDSLGRGTLGRAAQRQMDAVGCDRVGDYVMRLRGDERLRQQLIEELVVPETWFFRDRQPFSLVARLAPSRKRPLRLLSMPCSTGEEPYSLAMTLLETGLGPDQFSIDAVDISETSLAAAKRASYGGNSFRGEKEGAREMWFKPEAGRWQLDARVRAQVTFHHSNLFAYAPGIRYDFIFCRNLLIYFDAAEQSAAARSLLQLLMEDGVLFVGHAESAVMLREGLAVVPEPRSFAFTRKPAEVAKPVKPTVVRKPVPVAPPARPVSKVVQRAPAPAAKPAAPSLDGIKELADRGRLVEAAGLARAHVEAQGASVEALHLLAIIEDARGDTAAAEAAYRKVLYLDPKHDEAITHLALLLERRGDPEATRLWRRVKRPTAPGGKA